MPRSWTGDEINALARGFQPACVIMAAAELDVFGAMGAGPFTVSEAAAKLRADMRGMVTLLDALAALGLLDKQGDRYTPAPGVADVMTDKRPGSQLAMLRHQATCLRRWSQLAAVVLNGKPAERQPSIRGTAADYEAFIEAMDNVSGPAAPKIVGEIAPQLRYTHLLDVGGGSGTWTLAFLRLNPAARATIFDLPQVMPQARDRIAAAGMSGRVTLAPGDFYTDQLPNGADLAWVSAIVHQNSRQQNRELFTRVFAAINGGGEIVIRDFLMDESRTTPPGGAMFAVNMLVATERGGTFTINELSEDLASAGFGQVRILRRDDTMHSVLAARKP